MLHASSWQKVYAFGKRWTQSHRLKSPRLLQPGVDLLIAESFRHVDGPVGGEDGGVAEEGDGFEFALACGEPRIAGEFVEEAGFDGVGIGGAAGQWKGDGSILAAHRFHGGVIDDDAEQLRTHRELHVSKLLAGVAEIENGLVFRMAVLTENARELQLTDHECC